jgi:hypothetical protein
LQYLRRSCYGSSASCEPEEGRSWRYFIGVAVVLSQAYILLLGESIITAHTIVFVTAPQILWNVVVGLLLIGGEL